jgi:hypothetical protein
MTWDYATGQEYVRIEAVSGSVVVDLIAEIPLILADAEKIAEQICNAHNKSLRRYP